MISPAREAAYQIVRAISRGAEDLPAAIARVRRGLEDERDRSLASEIATGVERWRGALDHLIVVFSKRALDRLDPEVLDILRIGAYQLLHLSRVPASAVVDDAVNLAGRAGKRSAAGFVNAVLRTISRRRASLPLPARPGDGAPRDAVLDYLSVSLSHPRWLAARWLDRIGFDATERWMGFDNAPSPLTLRANRLRGTRDEIAARLAETGVSTEAARFAPDGLLVTGGHPLRSPGIESGWFVVQDEASQLVTLLAGSDPGRQVLDTCASPGGKTTALAAAVGAEGFVVACDIRPRRMEILRRAVAATGASNVMLVQADLDAGLPFQAAFDFVLVDAPCSGLGTLRRDPDIRWRRGEADIHRLALTQRRLLVRAAEAVRPGGRLVYATCSSEPEENDEVVDWFLESAVQFRAVDARGVHSGLPDAVVDDRGRLRTLPHVHALEGFFGAVFERV